MPLLPKLFIGSSKEAQDAGLLDSLLAALEIGLNMPTKRVELVAWPSSPWGNMTVAVQSLVENLVDYSYGIFILSADDDLTIRGAQQHAARDNVVFEFGLFLAHLGPERTFLIAPANTAKTVAMSKVKTSVAHTSAPPELPLRILTDLGSAYRKGNYTVANPGPTPTITFDVSEVVAAINAIETRTSGLSSAAAQSELDQRLLEAKPEIARLGKTDAYYSGQFFSRFRDIAMLKAQATARSVQNTVQDLLLTLERVGDFCDVAQLAREQHHSKSVSSVWVFADEPLEFRAGAPTDPAAKALRDTIAENLKNGVEYVYFVGPNFKKDFVDHLVAPTDPDRLKMLKCIHVVKVHSQFFSTYFTLHFEKAAKGPKAIYMSSVMKDRKDVLIQVSDTDHVDRIYQRICVLRGEIEHEDSPKVTRFVLH